MNKYFGRMTVFSFVTTLEGCGEDQFCTPRFLGVHEPVELLHFLKVENKTFKIFFKILH